MRLRFKKVIFASKHIALGNSLAVQWLGFGAFTAGACKLHGVAKNKQQQQHCSFHVIIAASHDIVSNTNYLLLQYIKFSK